MMTNQEIQKVTLEQLLIEIREVKNCISASEVRLRLDIQELRSKVDLLERENKELREGLESANRLENKKNIIVFGLEKDSKLSPELLCCELNGLLGTRVEASEISDFYTLGRTEKCPLKIEFVSYQTKKNIFNHVKKLKGSKVSIANDLTPKQRQENRRLRSFLLEAREKYTEKSYIKGNKLVVGQVAYDLEDLECSEEQNKVNSAPGTPTIRNSNQTLEETGSKPVNLAPGPSNINEGKRVKKILTPHLATHKRQFLTKKKSPSKENVGGMKESSPRENVGGMKLRHKSTTDK